MGSEWPLGHQGGVVTPIGFMSDEDIARGTGYTQAAAQIRYLVREGIAHHVDRWGKPQVTWAQWEAGKEKGKRDDGYKAPIKAA